MPLHLTSETRREKSSKTEYYLFTRIPRYLPKTMTPLFDTKIHVGKRRTFSLKCSAAEAWVINTNCSTLKAHMARRRAGPISRGRRMRQRPLAWMVLVVDSRLLPPKHTWFCIHLHAPKAGPLPEQEGVFLVSAEELWQGQGTGEQSCCGGGGLGAGLWASAPAGAGLHSDLRLLSRMTARGEPTRVGSGGRGSAHPQH